MAGQEEGLSPFYANLRADAGACAGWEPLPAINQRLIPPALAHAFSIPYHDLPAEGQLQNLQWGAAMLSGGNPGYGLAAASQHTSESQAQLFEGFPLGELNVHGASLPASRAPAHEQGLPIGSGLVSSGLALQPQQHIWQSGAQQGWPSSQNHLDLRPAYHAAVAGQAANMYENLRDIPPHHQQQINGDMHIPHPEHDGGLSRPPAKRPATSSEERSAGGGSDDEGPTRAIKRSRLVWTPALHQSFERVVNELGVKNAVPKTIMQKMNVKGLTRENVASHLQKYRLQLKRKEEKEEKPQPPPARDQFAALPALPGSLAALTQEAASKGTMKGVVKLEPGPAQSGSPQVAPERLFDPMHSAYQGPLEAGPQGISMAAQPAASDSLRCEEDTQL